MGSNDTGTSGGVPLASERRSVAAPRPSATARLMSPTEFDCSTTTGLAPPRLQSLSRISRWMKLPLKSAIGRPSSSLPEMDFRPASGWSGATHSTISSRPTCTCLHCGRTRRDSIIAMSIAPASSMPPTSSALPSTIVIEMRGYAAWKRAMTSGKYSRPNMGGMPRRMTPLRSSTASAISLTAASISSKMRAARASRMLPSIVGSTRCALRTKSVTPSSSSSFLMATDSAGCATCSDSAARVKLPKRAIARL